MANTGFTPTTIAIGSQHHVNSTTEIAHVHATPPPSGLPTLPELTDQGSYPEKETATLSIRH